MLNKIDVISNSLTHTCSTPSNILILPQHLYALGKIYKNGSKPLEHIL